MAERIGQQFGNYRLTGLLGQGGFADTYLGEHTYLKTFAAIKILHTPLGKRELEAFYNEARIIAKLKHPNIIRVLEFGVEDTVPYLVMEYAPHGTLRQLYDKGSILSPGKIIPYVRQIAAALQYAHDQKLVHRDVKPENMLLGTNNEVLLSDFGIAVIAQTCAQDLQNIAGTVTYMAPEQIQGKPRPASDQYSLAVVVYEWLCGAAPFTGTYTEIAMQHERVTPVPLRKQLAVLPSDIEEVVLTALSKDPQQRFSSVQAFAYALEQACMAHTPCYEYSISLADLLAPTDPRVNVSAQVATSHHVRPSGMIKALFHRSHKSEKLSSQQRDALSQENPGTSQSLEIAQLTEIGSANFRYLEPGSQYVPGASQRRLQRSSRDPWTPIPLSLYKPSSDNASYDDLFVPADEQISSSLSQFHSNSPAHNATIDAYALPAPRQQPTVTVVMLLITAVLLMGGLIYASLYQPAQFASLATATTNAGVIGTPQAFATSTAQTIAHANATVSAHVQATAAVAATQTALHDIYTNATSQTPGLNDPLKSSDSYGWQEFTDQNGECTFKDGAYHSTAAPNYFSPCIASDTNFHDFALQVEITILSGDAAGVIFRADNNTEKFYQFRIDTSGTYILNKFSTDDHGNNALVPLLSGSSSAIHTGNQANLITVIANKADIYLYVNQHYVDSTNDTSYKSGAIGVYAQGDKTSSTDAVFRNLQVWKL
jgi:serine/threonine protein kinase